MFQLQSTSRAQARDYPAEFVSDDGEVVEFRNGSPETLLAKAQRELAAFKFDLYETIAADPLVSDVCIRAMVALAGYVTVDKRTLQPTVAYLSNMSMMAEAGIRSKTTVGNIRRCMVKLGYWVDVGQTSDGCRLYRIENPRREVVQMHVVEAKEKLRADDASRKENERRRKAARSAERVPDNGTPKSIEGTKVWDDRVPNYDPNYLRANLGISSSEGQANLLAGPTADPDQPFPIPVSENDAVPLLLSLLDGKENRPGLINYFRLKLMKGELTPADIETHRRLVA
ncbi:MULTISPECIES: hypothetical protein [unclassified Mesorhizobium]|uniref:hypothetical protein n=1 Tax=unclassified Mesorhizobium TaxID=325217 RepID=UPI0010934991|nr:MULTISPECIES: hypothetical protein [unclassified Mesorhizobium]TGS47553.1 hypothetical protein EN825_00865 [Mesorhizobium sp. M8A.F.Ca.ET.182.01.1.1]TGS84158.1 hypothetical protein EN824_07265 [Mesorhizobium sp. M8A.F.Ca.ET.181.01.1.1]